mgnify:CR=1 FL=1
MHVLNVIFSIHIMFPAYGYFLIEIIEMTFLNNTSHISTLLEFVCLQHLKEFFFNDLRLADKNGLRGRLRSTEAENFQIPILRV